MHTDTFHSLYKSYVKAIGKETAPFSWDKASEHKSDLKAVSKFL